MDIDDEKVKLYEPFVDEKIQKKYGKSEHKIKMEAIQKKMS